MAKRLKTVDKIIALEKANRRCTKCGKSIKYPRVFCDTCRKAVEEAYQKSILEAQQVDGA